MTNQDEFYQRTELLLGAAAIEALKAAKVAVCGIGGVGAAATEALARAGVGALRLIDFDEISPSNLNRQLHTTRQNIGQVKAAAMADRIATINPDCQVEVQAEKITAQTVAGLLDGVDYIIDAIDDVPGKLALIQYAREKQIPIVVSLGTGNKLYPEHLELADISQTQVCPLARKLRRELKKLGIVKGLTVVYSKEQPIVPNVAHKEAIVGEREVYQKVVPGSVSFVPPVAGMILAGRVVRALAGVE